MTDRVTFLSSMHPLLPQGQYKLVAKQSVAAIGKDGTPYENRLDFQIGAPLTALLPTDLHSFYPPKGASGVFRAHLPHVVLMRPSLPWDSSLTDAPRDATDHRSALALLVIGASEMDGVKIQTTEEGRRSITLTGDLFRRIAPTQQDLTWIAHVRQVETEAKETPFFMSDGAFAVILASRFPEQPDPENGAQSGQNLAVLVSLARKAGLLRPDTDKDPTESPDSVALDLLADWRFTATAAEETAGEAAALTGARFAVDLPPATGTDSPETAHARDAFARGYCPLPHAMRHGDRTLSWYRGPLTPVDYGKPEAETAFRGSSDAALRYDPGDGMFDVSYAAAFQLGRLLALQDRGFASRMRRFRDDVRRQMNDLAGRSVTSLLLGGDSGQSERRQMAHALAAPDRLAGRDSAPRAGGVWVPGLREGKDVGLKLETPPEVARWLARLVLLYRVPYDYLVPDARLLPNRSLRFFQIDPNWLKCLLEGACSVGRVSAGDHQIDRWMRAHFLETALSDAPKVRRRADENAAAPLVRPAGENGEKTVEAKVQELVTLDWPLSGFLMKSPLVSHWNGLEMFARNAAGDQVLPLRIDRVAPDTLLCIFHGGLSEVEIRPPAEAIHHGAATGGEGYIKDMLRDPATGMPQKVTGGHSIPLRDAQARVIDLQGLGASLAKTLDVTGDFGSGDLAMQLIETTPTLVFRTGAS